MRLLSNKVLGGVFCGWLGLFWVSYRWGDPVPAEVGNRPLAAFPDRSIGFLSSAWFQKLSAWAIDHSPFRLRSIVERNRVLLNVARTLQPLPVNPGSGQVCAGRDGWLFMLDEAPERQSLFDQDRMVVNALEIARAVTASGRRFCLIPIPDKSSVYPEYAGTLLRWAYDRSLRERSWAKLEKGFESTPEVRSCYLPLWPAYAEARLRGRGQLYWEHDSHWNPEGMLVALPRLLEHLQPGVWDPQAVRYEGMIERHGDLMLTFLLQPETMSGKAYGISRTTERVEDHLVRGTALAMMVRYRSSDPRTIKGRTLIITDSFMEGAIPLFAPWFEDVTFAHFDCTGSQDLADRIRQCDTLVFTSVERLLRLRLKAWASDEYLSKVLVKQP